MLSLMFSHGWRTWEYWVWNYALDDTLHIHTLIHNQGQFRIGSLPTSMFLGGGKKKQRTQRKHTWTLREHAKLHTDKCELRIKQKTLELYSGNANAVKTCFSLYHPWCNWNLNSRMQTYPLIPAFRQDSTSSLYLDRNGTSQHRTVTAWELYLVNSDPWMGNYYSLVTKHQVEIFFGYFYPQSLCFSHWFYPWPNKGFSVTHCSFFHSLTIRLSAQVACLSGKYRKNTRQYRIKKILVYTVCPCPILINPWRLKMHSITFNQQWIFLFLEVSSFIVFFMIELGKVSYMSCVESNKLHIDYALMHFTSIQLGYIWSP